MRSGPLLRLELRPSVINQELWYPDRSRRKEWDRIRRSVLEKADFRCRFCAHGSKKYMHVHHIHRRGRGVKPMLVPVCVACHAVLHIGLNLLLGTIEIWKSSISQREIVRRTRSGIVAGKSLREIKAALPLQRGSLAPNSIEWANQLLREMGNDPIAKLRRPFCAVFVKFKRWQID